MYRMKHGNGMNNGWWEKMKGECQSMMQVILVGEMCYSSSVCRCTIQFNQQLQSCKPIQPVGFFWRSFNIRIWKWKNCGNRGPTLKCYSLIYMVFFSNLIVRIYSALQIHLFWFILHLSERKENNKEKMLDVKEQIKLLKGKKMLITSYLPSSLILQLCNTM